MAWRSPRYAYRHFLREAGAAALSTVNAFASDSPKERLLDERAGYLARFAASMSDHAVEVDFGLGVVNVFDRFWIPPGHNLTTAGITVSVYAGTSSPASTLLGSLTGPFDSDEGIDLELTQSSGRYVRVTFTGASGAWALGELLLTKTTTTVRGPEPGWEDGHRFNVLRFPKASGISAALEAGPPRRRIVYSYRDVRDSGDLTSFAAMIAYAGTSRPILVDPAYDDEYPVWMALAADPQSSQDAPAPASDATRHRSYRLELEEHLA